MFFLLYIASILSFATARLSVSFPLSHQLPNIARVSAPYEWQIFSGTFLADKGSNLAYSTPILPSWLFFNSSTLTFHGQPSTQDKGRHDVVLSTSDGKATVSSQFSLLVSDEAIPKLEKPISTQLLPNPSLASVFPLRNGSALSSKEPALRIPPAWSFSVGFEGKTFSAINSLYYDALQADGSPLPSWIKFNPSDITFDGVTPKLDKDAPPQVLSLALHASDIRGYTAVALPFNLFIAAHELSIATATLPTINITSGTPFNISLSSPADFSGVLWDDGALDPTYIQDLEINVLRYADWLNYDRSQRQLSGTPPSNVSSPLFLPVKISVTGNQTIQATVPLALESSFFIKNSLDSVSRHTGDPFNFNLTRSFSDPNIFFNAPASFELTTEYSPTSAGDFLHFDPSTAQLNGTIPKDCNQSAITITFTAASHITHSTSHTSLQVLIANGGSNAHVPAKHRAHAMQGLQIACAVIGGLLFLGIILAIFRVYARTPDSALEGAAAVRCFSDAEKQYYGFEEPLAAQTASSKSPGITAPASSADIPRRVISKGAFLGNLRSTIRTASQRYRAAGQQRPIISKPISVTGSTIVITPVPDIAVTTIVDPPASDSCATSDASTVRSDSPAGQSIPQRRPDFVPIGATGHSLTRTTSNMSKGSERSGTSGSVDEEEEAVVQTASRAKSVHSARSSGGLSHQSTPAVGPPRLVPFVSGPMTPTSVPSSINHPRTGTRRVASQHAFVERRSPLHAETADDLSLGVHYVRSLGEDMGGDRVSIVSSSLSPSLRVDENSRNARYSSCSFSLASSKYTQRDERGNIPQILARAGERFKFRMPLDLERIQHGMEVRVRLMNGNSLPDCIKTEMVRGEILLSGIPRVQDVGEVYIGSYDSATGECVGRVLLEIIERN